MSLRPTRRVHHLQESVHLNITPFIDILVCLILFLLSAAAFLKLSTVDTNLPRIADVAMLQEEKKDDDKLIVSVKIDPAGFLVSRVGEDKDGNRQRRWEQGGDLRRMIPRSGNAYNLVALTEHMMTIKRSYPEAVSVMILPAGNVSYQTIVDVMDATREAPTKEENVHVRLFPDAIIGHSMEEGEI